MAADVFGLTTRMRIAQSTPFPCRRPSHDAVCRACSIRMTISAVKITRNDTALVSVPERIDVRLGDGGGQALQFQRQGVDGADRLAGARELVPGQGEAEQADADHRWQDDRQHHMAERLPRRRAEVARRFFIAAVERLKIANMISRPNGRVQVRWAPRPEVNSPIAVVRAPSERVLDRNRRAGRNSSAMPSEVMIDGMIRLAMAT